MVRPAAATSAAAGYIQLGAVYCTEGQNTNENSISIYSTATAPGTYELRYRVRAEDPAATRRLRWGLRCSSGAPPRRTRRRRARKRLEIARAAVDS